MNNKHLNKSREISIYDPKIKRTQFFWSFHHIIKQPRAAASQRLIVENVRDTAPKIAKLEHEIATYKIT